MNKVFSLPINPKFNPQFIETKFLDFLKTNKDYIFDLAILIIWVLVITLLLINKSKRIPIV